MRIGYLPFFFNTLCVSVRARVCVCAGVAVLTNADEVVADSKIVELHPPEETPNRYFRPFFSFPPT